MWLAGWPARVLNEPPTTSWPLGIRARQWTEPSVPAVGASQLLPSQMAMLSAGVPPAVAKLPAAAMSPGSGDDFDARLQSLLGRHQQEDPEHGAGGNHGEPNSPGDQERHRTQQARGFE